MRNQVAIPSLCITARIKLTCQRIYKQLPEAQTLASVKNRKQEKRVRDRLLLKIVSEWKV